jgi:hypothetical protein
LQFNKFVYFIQGSTIRELKYLSYIPIGYLPVLIYKCSYIYIRQSFVKSFFFEEKIILQDASCKFLEKRRKAGIAALPKGAPLDY